VELALSGTNLDGAGDCPRRLQPLVRPRAADPAPRQDGAEHDCYEIDGSWTIEPTGELHIRYQGAISRADTRLSPPAAIDQRQGETMVLPRQAVLDATEGILSDNGIRAQGSPDMLDIWNGKESG
jgi:hypothetical protein